MNSDPTPAVPAVEPTMQAGEQRPAADVAEGELNYLRGLDRLRQEAGITAAMLRDGRARRLVESSESQPNILLDDLKLAWRHAVRAFNYCDNEGMKDTGEVLAIIVVKLSQQLEFADTMNDNEQYIPEGHHVVEDADGERFVKND